MSIEAFKSRTERAGLPALESRLAAWVRAYDISGEHERLEAENSLLRLLVDLAVCARRTEDPSMPDPDRGIDRFALAISNVASEANPDASLLHLFASLSFALGGNFASARVAARRWTDVEAAPLGIAAWMAGTLRSRSLATPSECPAPLRPYATALETGLRTGDEASFRGARTALEEAFRQSAESGAGLDTYLLMLWTAVHRAVARHSVARVLMRRERPDPAYVRSLISSGIRVLFPSQLAAVANGAVMHEKHSALVVMPTSAGKSLLGELALMSSMSTERPLGVYLAPYRALVEQLTDRMRPRLHGAGVNCILRSGGYLSDSREVALAAPTVIVATPESFDSLVRELPELLKRCGCVVMDECHLIEQAPRGLRYEGLVARLRRLPQTERPRIVALSPVLTNTDRLAAFLSVPASGIVRDSWQPTAKIVGYTTPSAQVAFFDVTRASNAGRSEPQFLGSVSIPNPNDEEPAETFGQEGRNFSLRMSDNVVAVAVDQHARLKAPVLCMAATRQMARVMAGSIASRLDTVPGHGPAATLAADLSRRYPFAVTLRRCLLAGVAYHHAGLPAWVRRRVQDLVAARDLRVVAATTTLAEGVDLPFRCVVMSAASSFGQGWQQLPALLFRNIAGRCGRAGEFLEGDTIVVDRPSHEPEWWSFEQRAEAYFATYVRPRELVLRSSIELAVEIGGASAQAAEGEPEDAPDRRRDRVVRSVRNEIGSQFAAFLPYVRGMEGQVQEFARNLLASGSSAVSAFVEETLERVVASCLDGGDLALMQQRSPLELTPLGQASLASGASTDTIRSIAAMVASYANRPDHGAGLRIRAAMGVPWRPLLGLMAQASLARDLYDEIKQARQAQPKTVGLPIRDTDFASMVLSWAAGWPLVDMLELAVGGRTSAAGRAVTEWLDGDGASPPAEVEDSLEQLAVASTSVFSETFAWIMRTTARVAEQLGRFEVVALAKADALAMETGASQPLAATLLLEGCELERSKLDYLVRCCGARLGSPPERGQFARWLTAEGAGAVGSQIGRRPWFRLEADELDEAHAFVMRSV